MSKTSTFSVLSPLAMSYFHNSRSRSKYTSSFGLQQKHWRQLQHFLSQVCKTKLLQVSKNLCYHGKILQFDRYDIIQFFPTVLPFLKIVKPVKLTARKMVGLLNLVILCIVKVHNCYCNVLGTFSFHLLIVGLGERRT